MTYLLDKPVVSPLMVGRQAEAGILHQLIDLAQQGQGQVILISGEAGVGKSRLVNEAQVYAREHNFRILHGSSFPRDFACPYAPILDLLHNYFAESAAPPISQSLKAELARLLPDLVRAESIGIALLDPEYEKRKLFVSLAQFFIEQSATQPVAVIVEDIHWSDDTSLDYFHYLARRCSAQKLILFFTYRSDEIAPRLNQWLAQMDRDHLSQELELHPLMSADMDNMLRGIFQTSQPVPRELLSLLYSLTEGNPFFLEEVLKSLISLGEVFYEDGSWSRNFRTSLHIPRNIQGVIHQRMDKLDDPARKVITLAAVMGRRFSFDLLLNLTRLDETHLIAICKELVAAQLIIEETSEQFAFRHALIQQAIYASLLARERRSLHHTIAQIMETHYSNTLDAHLNELAYHMMEAEQWQKALTFSTQAAQKSQALDAPRATVAHLTRVLQATKNLSTSPALELYRMRGQAYETLGEFDTAQADYQVALEASIRADNHQTTWQLLLDLGNLWAGRSYEQTGIYYQRALQLARELNEPSALAHSLNRLGNWYLNMEQPLESLRLHHEAEEIFESVDDQPGLAETYDLIGMSNYLGANLPEGTEYYTQAIAVFRQTDNRRALSSINASLMLGSGVYQTDTMSTVGAPLQETIALGQQALKDARDIGWRAGEAYALWQLGCCWGSQGEYGLAFGVSRQALNIAEEIEHHQWMTSSHWILGVLFLDLLDGVAAQKHLKQSLALAKQVDSLLWTRMATACLATSYLVEGAPDLAEGVLASNVNLEAAPHSVGQRMIWCVRTEFALQGGDPDLAMRLIDQLYECSASADRTIPRLQLLRARALILQGLLPEAETSLQAGLNSASRQGALPMEWRIRLALCNLYKSMSRPEEAQSEFVATRTILERMADHLPDEALKVQFLRRTLALIPAQQLPTARQLARQSFDGLTEREREVVTLIAEGKSNQEIADALVIGKRTVETHIANVLSKLGMTSRSQVIRWALAKGLTNLDH